VNSQVIASSPPARCRRTRGTFRGPSFLLLFLFLQVAAATRLTAATQIHVLVVYDSTATAWVNSHGANMSTFAGDQIGGLNQMLQNSGVSLTMSLAYAGQVSYTQSGSVTADHTALKNGTGGLATAHQWRDTYQADLVVMFVDTTDPTYSGYGSILQSYAGQPSAAFTVVDIVATEIDDIFMHEVGHNLGCGHSRKQAASPGPNSALNNYSAGHYFTGATDGKKYATVMSYNNDGYGTNYYNCPYFSTPNRTYMGTPVGVANSCDNARTISETMGVVSAYRAGSPSTTTTRSTTSTRTTTTTRTTTSTRTSTRFSTIRLPTIPITTTRSTTSSTRTSTTTTSIAPTSWYRNATSTGGGWMNLTWFGDFWVGWDPWVYHSTHGWLYYFGSDPSLVWFWDDGMKMYWRMSESNYPYLWRSGDNCWLWYWVGTTNPRVFWNYCTSQWESW